MGDEKRPHCPTGGGVHIIKSGANWVPGGPESSQNDLEASLARFSSMLLSRWARVFSKRFGGEWRGIRGEKVEGGG